MIIRAFVMTLFLADYWMIYVANFDEQRTILKELVLGPFLAFI